MQDYNMLSVICPIYNEEKYISTCIESILQQDYPKQELEIIFVDGMSTDNTRRIVSEYIVRYPFIRLIDNPYRIVPYAMNIGIENSCGDIIIRLDAHASYANNYFSVLVTNLRKLNADNVGTVCRTDVLRKTKKSLAIKEVLSNRFGVGNSTFRTGIDKVMQVDTVPFGCWPRNVFDRYGLYDVRLVRNQDIELNKRILRGGGKIYIVPDSYCTYYARETFTALSKNNFANGKWNILTVFYTKQFNSLSLRHFVPLIFLLSLLLPLLVSPFWLPISLLTLLSATMYFLLIGSVCVRLSITKHLNICYLFASFVVLHLSYGYGSLVGLCKLPFVKE